MKKEIFEKVKGQNIEDAKKILVANGYCEYFMRIVECSDEVILKVKDNASTFTSLYDFGNGIAEKILIEYKKSVDK